MSGKASVYLCEQQQKTVQALLAAIFTFSIGYYLLLLVFDFGLKRLVLFVSTLTPKPLK